MNSQEILDAHHKALDETIAALKAENERLRAGLRALIVGYVGTLENGRERILFLGGECDSVEVMERGDPHLIRAKALLITDAGTAQPNAECSSCGQFYVATLGHVCPAAGIPEWTPACKVDSCYNVPKKNGYCGRHWAETAEALDEQERAADLGDGK
jgi:hypothetical protein